MNHFKGEKGAALVLTLMIITLFLLFILAQFTQITNTTKQITTMEDQIDARLIAEMGTVFFQKEVEKNKGRLEQIINERVEDRDRGEGDEDGDRDDRNEDGNRGDKEDRDRDDWDEDEDSDDREGRDYSNRDKDRDRGNWWQNTDHDEKEEDNEGETNHNNQSVLNAINNDFIDELNLGPVIIDDHRFFEITEVKAIIENSNIIVKFASTGEAFEKTETVEGQIIIRTK